MSRTSRSKKIIPQDKHERQALRLESSELIGIDLTSELKVLDLKKAFKP